MDYCPVNDIKQEVLSELFDCEPDLLITPPPGSPVYPAFAASALVQQQQNSSPALQLPMSPLLGGTSTAGMMVSSLAPLSLFTSLPPPSSQLTVASPPTFSPLSSSSTSSLVLTSSSPLR